MLVFRLPRYLVKVVFPTLVAFSSRPQHAIGQPVWLRRATAQTPSGLAQTCGLPRLQTQHPSLVRIAYRAPMFCKLGPVMMVPVLFVGSSRTSLGRCLCAYMARLRRPLNLLTSLTTLQYTPNAHRAASAMQGSRSGEPQSCVYVALLSIKAAALQRLFSRPTIRSHASQLLHTSLTCDNLRSPRIRGLRHALWSVHVTTPPAAATTPHCNNAKTAVSFYMPSVCAVRLLGSWRTA